MGFIGKAADDRPSAALLVREYLDAIIVAGLVALFLTTFVIRTFYIPSISMIPTLQVSDMLLVNELDYHLHPPRVGDVAVFTPPIQSGGDAFIKRVIGVAGDTIRIANGIVYRNGVALNEPYENQAPDYDLVIAHYGIYVNGQPLDPSVANVPPRSDWTSPDRIPPGFVFMLGDNRNYSEDSHVWGFAQLHGHFAAGPLAHSATLAGFTGRAMMIFWPFDRIRILH